MTRIFLLTLVLSFTLSFSTTGQAYAEPRVSSKTGDENFSILAVGDSVSLQIARGMSWVIKDKHNFRDVEVLSVPGDPGPLVDSAVGGVWFDRNIDLLDTNHVNLAVVHFAYNALSGCSWLISEWEFASCLKRTRASRYDPFAEEVALMLKEREVATLWVVPAERVASRYLYSDKEFVYSRLRWAHTSFFETIDRIGKDYNHYSWFMSDALGPGLSPWKETSAGWVQTRSLESGTHLCLYGTAIVGAFLYEKVLKGQPLDEGEWLKKLIAKGSDAPWEGLGNFECSDRFYKENPGEPEELLTYMGFYY